MTFAEILAIYAGSNGDATRDLFARLDRCGSLGAIAVNVFRAAKNSERAKVYRGGQRGGGSFRRMAYDRKSWAIDNLAAILTTHGDAVGICWGWAVDAEQQYHRDILYVDLPTGQVSFHTTPRGTGPNYEGQWDGMRGAAPQRVSRFCADVLADEPQ